MGLASRLLVLVLLVCASQTALAAAAHAMEGKISYYGKGFRGKLTACGEIFDDKLFTMAHRTLPCGTKVQVTNLRNQRTVVVRVNDRGPHVKGRVADVSTAAARQLRMVQSGVVRGRLRLDSETAPVSR
jgi:rare lipoprotein A